MLKRLILELFWGWWYNGVEFRHRHQYYGHAPSRIRIENFRPYLIDLAGNHVVCRSLMSEIRKCHKSDIIRVVNQHTEYFDKAFGPAS